MSVTVTVSGSFRRHIAEIQRDVNEFSTLGASVLSPADPRVVDAFGEFLFVASDRLRTVRTVQSRHLLAIASSDFLWLVCPDGYVGPSAAMEIGYANARDIPVLAATPPTDLTMRQFVQVVPSLCTAVERTAGTQAPTWAALVDPETAVEHGHEHLEAIRRLLLQPANSQSERHPLLAQHAVSVSDIVRGLD